MIAQYELLFIKSLEISQSEGGGEAAAARPIKIPGRVGLGGLLLSLFPSFPFPSFPFPAGGSQAAGCEN